MGRITYRELGVDEVPLLGMIDRSEVVDGVYRGANGALELDAVHREFPTWSGEGLTRYISRLQSLMESGGRVLGAWNEEALVGIGSLDPSGVGGDKAVMQLDMLYVSAGFRGRGIGRRLTEMIAEVARSLGATALYISATPTKRTVDAYLRMGARILSEPDPELFAREPEDIHFILDLD